MKTIRTYTNVAEAGFASSLLESAGIRTLLAGEESFLMTPGLATGGIQLQVEDENAEKALRLLNEGFDAVADAPNAGSDPELPATAAATAEGRIPVGIFVAGAATLALLFFVVDQWNKSRRGGGTNRATEHYESDYDHDGRSDRFFEYRNGVIQRADVDRDHDGRIDEWATFDGEGRSETSAQDQNFDGRPDTWFSYRDGEVQRSERDTDFDGRPDWFGSCQHGVMVREDCRPGNSEIIIRRYIFVNGLLREEQVDENRDGVFDYKMEFDPFSNASNRIPMDREK